MIAGEGTPTSKLTLKRRTPRQALFIVGNQNPKRAVSMEEPRALVKS